MAQSGSDEFIKQALELPHDTRARLAAMLLASLDDERSDERAQVDVLWAEEIARRREAVRTGNADEVSWDAVYAELKARRGAMSRGVRFVRDEADELLDHRPSGRTPQEAPGLLARPTPALESDRDQDSRASCWRGPAPALVMKLIESCSRSP